LVAETHCIKKIAKRSPSSSTNYLMLFTFIIELTDGSSKIDYKIEDLNRMMVRGHKNEQSEEVLNLYIIHCLMAKNIFGKGQK
jgi:hypothetical protein